MALSVGLVKQLSGLVMVKNAMGEERVLAIGDTIHFEETISTLGAGSRVMLSLSDGREITLNGNDGLKIDASVYTSNEGFGHDAVVANQTVNAIISGASVEQIQAALLKGEDISNLEATAAGEAGTSTASSLMSGFATARYVSGGNESSVESSQRSIDETPNDETPLILTDTQATQTTTSMSEVITDTTPPDSSKLAITNIVDNTGNYASVTISGTGAEEGNTITLYDEDNNVVATAIIQADGTWNADISNLPNTPVGDNEFFKVTETDASGNTTAQSTAVHYYHGAGTGAYTEQTDDFVLLGDGNDLVYTDSASPIAYRDDSNDTLVIDGGNGADTVLFGKNASEYTITTTASGSILVSENVSSDSDGNGIGDVTELRNVEKLQFLDGAYYPYNTAATLSVTTVTTFVEDASSNGVGSVVAHYSTSDVDGDSVSVNLSDTTHYALDGSGNVTLTAAGVALVNAGSDLPAFTLTPNDGKTLGSAVSVDPSVTVVNDAPIASASSDSVNEDALSVSITPVQGGVNLLAGLSDEDTSSGHSIAQISSDNSHYTAVSSSGTLIKVGFSYTNAEGATSTIYLPVKINTDGSYAISQSELLNAIPEGQSATGSFWYTISDGETTNNLSIPQQFTMTILGQNDAPEVNVTTLETMQTNADIPVMVKLSGDRFNTSTGDAPKFNIYVDGVKLNDSPLSVEEFRSYNISSSLGSVARQTSYEYVTFDVAQGTKSIAIEFVQDAYEGGGDTDGDGYSEDRNLIVDSITIGGTVSTGANGTLQISGGVTLQAEDKSVSSYIASGTDRSGTETMAWNGKMTFNVENAVAGATSNASFQTENFNEDVVSQTGVTGSVSLLNGATDVDGKTSDLTISQADGSSFSAPIVVTFNMSGGGSFDANVTLKSNGEYSIEANSAFNTIPQGEVATGSFDFYIRDANGGVSEKQTFTMNVEGKNDAPIAVNDTLNITEDTSTIFTLAQLMGNDTDVDSSALSIHSVTSGTNGTAFLNSNGTITFTPNENFSGTADFTYTISDGTTVSNAATVSIVVSSVADAPVLFTQNITALNQGATVISTHQSDTIITAQGVNYSNGVSQTNLEVELGVNANYLDTFNPNGSDSGTVNVIDGKVSESHYTMGIGMSVSWDYSFRNGEDYANQISDGFNDIVVLLVTDPLGVKTSYIVNASEMTGTTFVNNGTYSYTASMEGNYTFAWLVLNGSDVNKDSSLSLSNANFKLAGDNTVYGAPISLSSLYATLGDTDGSETLSVVISGVPSNATFSSGTKNSDGTWSFSENDLEDLYLLPADNYTGMINLSITATATEANGSSASVSEIMSVTISETSSLLSGTENTNTLNGTNENDLMRGYAGNDTLNGNNGNDILFGGAGNDILNGGNGSDTLDGGVGNDILNGGNVNDTLDGGAGVDQLYGGNNNDIFVYDSADSVIHGGNGVDTLLFSHDATVDLSGITDGKIESIEVLDLTKASVELSINPADVLNITDDSNTILKILGGSDDTLHGTGWTQTTGADAGFTRFESSDHVVKMDVQESIVHTDFH